MDIVKRLRGDYEIDQIFKTTPICHEAADEIERLRRRVEVLEMDYSHSIKESIDLGNGWKDVCDKIERLQKTLRTVKHYLVYLDGTIERTLGEKE